MATKEVNKTSWKPFIIANPIYDTVFKRLMEDQRIAKFFLSTILGQKIKTLTLMPQEFTYKLDEQNVETSGDEKQKRKDKVRYYSYLRLDFMATVLDEKGKARKILIELQKSWDILDVMRFRTYLGEQYKKKDSVDSKNPLPITTIYILGTNLPETDCPCIKVGRTYIDMRNRKPIETKSEFIENLTHDSYVIQAGRITDTRYITNLDKLLSIFEQRYFIVDGSDVTKEYRYQPDDENITLITDILYEMGADPEERKRIENEKEFLRIVNEFKDPLRKELEEKDRALEEKDKKLEEKDKTIEEIKKAFEEQTQKLVEMEHHFQNKQNE
jgi:hypothetical protein